MSNRSIASVARNRLRSFRAASTIFALATIVIASLFVLVLVRRDEIRSGLATYGLITGIAAVGLWKGRAWGRSLGLLITLASAGLGTLTLMSVLLARDGSFVVPLIVLVASSGVAYWLSRPAFEVPRADE